MKKVARERRERIKEMRRQQMEKTKHIAPPEPMHPDTIKLLQRFSADFRKAVR